MKRFFRVDLKNGNFKDFDSEEKARAYEEELYCKEQQELERQKKIEAEKSKKLAEKQQKYDKIKNLADEVSKLTLEYQEEYKEPVYYTIYTPNPYRASWWYGI